MVENKNCYCYYMETIIYYLQNDALMYLRLLNVFGECGEFDAI